MAKTTNIQWCDATWNPWRGCSKCSAGCLNCYAARDSVRFPNIRGIWGDAGTRIVAVPGKWQEPVQWNRKAMKEGVRMRVFCASLADVFEDWKGLMHHPHKDGGVILAAMQDGKMVRQPAGPDARPMAMADARDQLFALIERTPWLDWQLLTKRPENVMRMVPAHWRDGFPPNVWMGTTAENQDMADQRILSLLSIPAQVRFLSCEPLLGPLDLSDALCIEPNRGGGWRKDSRYGETSGIHWVIGGGESGPKARAMDPAWAYSLLHQCATARVPFFMKQMGGATKPFPEIPYDMLVRQFPASLPA